MDVDALCDGHEVWIGGIMQHVEEAGVHSGDSACVLPPHSLGEEMLEQIRSATREIALAVGVVGLLNVQYAVHAGELYVIEANPRASRTVPFVSKAVGLPLAKLACRIMLGERIADMGLPRQAGIGFGDHVSVKEAVLPFDRFDGSDAVLGPEMRSTGEVMGIARDFPTAFAKAQAAAGVPLPSEGTAFITVTDSDKAGAFAVAQILHDSGFQIVATRGTAEAISRMGIPVQGLNKIGEGSPHVLDWIERGDVDLVVNTPTGVGARTDGWEIRRAAVSHGIPCLTTLSAGVSAARAIARAHRDGEPEVHCLQDLHGLPRRQGAQAPGAAGGARGGVSAPFARRELVVASVSQARRIPPAGRRGHGRAGAAGRSVLHAGRRRASGAAAGMSARSSRAPSRSPAGGTASRCSCSRPWAQARRACAPCRRVRACGPWARSGRASQRPRRVAGPSSSAAAWG